MCLFLLQISKMQLLLKNFIISCLLIKLHGSLSTYHCCKIASVQTGYKNNNINLVLSIWVPADGWVGGLFLLFVCICLFVCFSIPNKIIWQELNFIDYYICLFKDKLFLNSAFTDSNINIVLVSPIKIRMSASFKQEHFLYLP